MVRSLLAIPVALLVAFALVIAVELFGNAVHPLPSGTAHTPEAICEHVKKFPAWVLACVMALWALLAGISAWLATRLGRGKVFGIVVAVLLFAALVMNLSMLPYPGWFKVGTILTAPLASWWGIRKAILKA